MARVLLINDEPDLIAMCEIVLEDHGHEVRHTLAPHRVQELAALAKWRPDAVVLDLVMPGTTGEEVLSRLRHMPGMAHVPVLVMSAMSEADERAKAMGADGFLEKPFDPDGLVNALDLVLASARAPRSRRHHAAPRTTRHDSQR